MPSLELIADLLLKLILPAALSSCLIASAIVLGTKTRAWRAGVSLGVGVGLFVGNWNRASIPYIPEFTGWDWLLPAALLALVLGALVACFAPHQPAIGLAVNAIAAATSSYSLVPEELRDARWLVGFAFVSLANVFALGRMAKQNESWITPATWAAIIAGGVSAVMIYSHSARLADAAILLAAALAGIAIIAAWKPLSIQSTALAVGIYVPGVALSGYHGTFSEVPLTSFVLAGIVPAVLLVMEIPGLQRLPVWGRYLMQVVLLSAVAGLAVVLAIRAEGLSLQY